MSAVRIFSIQTNLCIWPSCYTSSAILIWHQESGGIPTPLIFLYVPANPSGIIWHFWMAHVLHVLTMVMLPAYCMCRPNSKWVYKLTYKSSLGKGFVELNRSQQKYLWLFENMWIYVNHMLSMSLLTHPIPSFTCMYYSLLALLVSEAVYISQDTCQWNTHKRFLRRCLNCLSHHLKGKWPSICWNSSAYLLHCHLSPTVKNAWEARIQII